MSKPEIHAESSVRRWGGKIEDYLEIHQFFDSSKGVIADSRHRAMFHNSFIIMPGGVLERIFGVTLTNSDGRKVQVRDVGEQHILEDFGGRFIPSAQDYLQEIEMQEWMRQGKGAPPSFAKIFNTVKTAVRTTLTRWKNEELPELPSESPPSNVLPVESDELFVDGANAYRPRRNKDFLD